MVASLTLRSLGTSPDPDDVDRWMLDQGLIRHVVGKSFLGRDLVAYSSVDPNRANNGNDGVPNTNTLLLVSLVHANEPTGLLALLASAETLLLQKNSTSSTTLVFFPFVNIDAYQVNRPIGGCRRANLHTHATCLNILRSSSSSSNNQDALSAALPCPATTYAGVDINRNFPSDFLYQHPDTTNVCSPTYAGTHPFSEPESQAMRNVVTIFSPVTHFLSFHSRNSHTRPRVLIHPFGSQQRSLEEDMPLQRRQQYETWTPLLQEAGQYVKAGTAYEAIGYYAQGTAMDWLERSHSVYSYVMEVVPPPSGKIWCTDDDTDSCWKEAAWHAKAARVWLELLEGREPTTRSVDATAANSTPPSLRTPPQATPQPTPPTVLVGTLNGFGGLSRSSRDTATSIWLVSVGVVLVLISGVLCMWRQRRLSTTRHNYRITTFASSSTEAAT